MTTNADMVVEALGTATEENQISPFRDNQVINLPAEGEVWIAGDIHDHRRNFEKYIRNADLGNNPQRHIVLQELIHGDHFDEKGAEESWKILVRAAELKCDYPNQVHFLLANHDLAQVHGEGIMKAGLSVCEAFNAGVKRDFGDRRGIVHAAISEFLLSFPLGVRCPNGVFFCHSVPADSELETFDYTVFNRPLTGPDYKRRVGPVYQLIWGRKTSPDGAKAFAEKLGANILVTGHQPQEMGYTLNGPHHLIIASEHNQGVMLSVNLDEEYTIETLVRGIRKFVSMDLPD
ncbi:MAG TPA: metallophosphoesterase [Tepidisphaeraceae bacterium]|nr:metallophosphoesterase [Tepidisphaeraceae bacterium]